MATTTTNLRSRRSEAQLHALAGVEREIRVTDPSSRRKYLRDFSQAFRSYESVISLDEAKRTISAADIVLVGDYHALPACQRFAAGLLEERAQPGDRPVVLGLETIFARDQHILDEWWRREIDEAELRQRIRFDLDWGYDWTPLHELLVTAREHAEAIYGLDCMPREDLRKIGARDRHAAHKIEEIRQRHPAAAIFVLFGESHLAPGHLPRVLREQLPAEKIVTVLQNIDSLYWHAAGERHECVEAVRLNEGTVCVFNSTPLEKYENYRLHLSRWGRTEEEGPDLAPTIYNLIDSLLRFLDINRYSSHNSTQPKFLVDLLPEIHCGISEGRLRRLLAQESTAPEDQEAWLRRIEERGSVYLPTTNAFYVREFQMVYAAEEVARFLHSACRGLPRHGRGQPDVADPADRFYTLTLEYALGYFGSRVLYPARHEPSDAGELSQAACESAMKATLHGNGNAFRGAAQCCGYALGSRLYDKYLVGSVSRSQLRHLFLSHLNAPGRARQLCWQLTRRSHPARKPPQSERRLRPRRLQSATA
jgi:Haem-binding uptake, Tiki superfamily, ChaN